MEGLGQPLVTIIGKREMSLQWDCVRQREREEGIRKIWWGVGRMETPHAAQYSVVKEKERKREKEKQFWMGWIPPPRSRCSLLQVRVFSLNYNRRDGWMDGWMGRVDDDGKEPRAPRDKKRIRIEFVQHCWPKDTWVTLLLSLDPTLLLLLLLWASTDVY